MEMILKGRRWYVIDDIVEGMMKGRRREHWEIDDIGKNRMDRERKKGN